MLFRSQLSTTEANTESSSDLKSLLTESGVKESLVNAIMAKSVAEIQKVLKTSPDEELKIEQAVLEYATICGNYSKLSSLLSELRWNKDSKTVYNSRAQRVIGLLGALEII